jgi:hypothetical protein
MDQPDDAVGAIVIIDRDVSVAWQLCASDKEELCF